MIWVLDSEGHEGHLHLNVTAAVISALGATLGALDGMSLSLNLHNQPRYRGLVLLMPLPQKIPASSTRGWLPSLGSGLFSQLPPLRHWLSILNCCLGPG